VIHNEYLVVYNIIEQILLIQFSNACFLLATLYSTYVLIKFTEVEYHLREALNSADATQRMTSCSCLSYLFGIRNCIIQFHSYKQAWKGALYFHVFLAMSCSSLLEMFVCFTYKSTVINLTALQMHTIYRKINCPLFSLIHAMSVFEELLGLYVRLG